MNIQYIETQYQSIFTSIEEITNLRHNKKKVLICTHNALSSATIQRILNEHECRGKIVTNIQDVGVEDISICQYDIKKSFIYEDCYFFTEERIFGKAVASAHKKREISTKKKVILANGYSQGDLVVHKKYGVAKFDGLLLIKNNEKEYDTAKLIYKGGDILYIPVINIEYITKYGNIPDGVEIENLLDKLNTNSFNTKKTKVKKDLFVIAEKLVKETAKRKMIEAPIFLPNEITKKFDEKFLFILTEDQELAINDCYEDLALGKPMERLICGDVGFGKTEVAMRCVSLIALGREINENFGQVCIICPTTLLAQQHYKTFTVRFEGFNVKIAKITRTTSSKEKKDILDKLQIGEIDILITTHSGFHESVAFKNLNLLIIDEEQHFGVEQKEKMKERFTDCHILLLSATPIPRTLQMGLSGLKDISIISTPPFDRILPQTQIITFNSTILANAILREKARNGRTFFVCPRIADLEEQKTKLFAILGDEVNIGVAHGQLPASELEDAMEKFYSGVYDVLVTTSIVESGIDISFANTMILYRAEMFGLAALYQLRGRVGRGKTQSYVYFLVHDSNKMTENAKQRLKAISSITSLGDGMKISMSDLDIRGAGNIVGKEQHGKINDVGVELYEQMLQDAVLEVKNEGKNTHKSEITEIKIGIPYFIPEEYIPDFSLRMQIYRELSSLTSNEDMEIIKTDIIDRFGKIPLPMENLIEVIKVKIHAMKLYITKIEIGIRGCVVEFSEFFEKSEALLHLIQKNSQQFQIRTANSIFYQDNEADSLQKVKKILNIIENL